MTEHEKVKQFHEATGQAVRTSPTMPSDEERLLRCRLLLEETMEFIHACGFDACIDGGGRTHVFRVQGATFDLAAMASENADVRYIAHGNDLTMGVDGRVFDAIHEANMAKVGPDGKVTRRADGKIVKPEGWKPADVAGLLERWDDDSRFIGEWSGERDKG